MKYWDFCSRAIGICMTIATSQDCPRSQRPRVVAALRVHAFACGVAILAGCGSSGSSSSTLPPPGGPAKVRFIDGAPLIETIIAGIPQQICVSASAPCYLQVNGNTVSSSFFYGAMTTFVNVIPGMRSLSARTVQGYSVGPFKTAKLEAGKRYTVIVVGTYPNYSALTFDEPVSNGSAQLSLYEASPAVPTAAFGSFRASSKSDFKQLGAATLGTVSTVTVGKSVTNFGGYAGSARNPIGALELSKVNSFDRHSALPFHDAQRLSLFLFNRLGSTTGEIFGSLDR